MTSARNVVSRSSRYRKLVISNVPIATNRDKTIKETMKKVAKQIKKWNKRKGKKRS
jgi:flagellar capping protein FliD